ncbi:MAG: acyl-CoA dehydrogenase family protein [Spirochaetota bacterium]|nr:acyl-CoA dehydrogenase family protein [Spirochaetota bacterium]
MELSLNEEQEILKSSARNFLKEECPSSVVIELEDDEKGFIPELWRKMADLGWMGLILPPEYGGSGADFLYYTVLLEEMGRACMPSWFFSTIALGAQIILDTGTDDQKSMLLPSIASGDSVGTLALIDPKSSYDVRDIQMTSKKDGDDYILDGIKLFVPDAHIADWIVCITKGEGKEDGEPLLKLFQIDIKSPGISITQMESISDDRIFEVKFDGVRIPADNLLGSKEHSASVIEKILQRSALAKCAEIVGGCQFVLDMTVEYAKQRIQFNRLIGSYQAIQHHCANMLIDLDCSRYLTYYTAWMLSEGMECEKELAMTKSFVSDACIKITTLGQQVNGGTGLMKESDMQLYFRRAKAASLTLGSATFQRKIVAREMGLRVS